LPLSEEVDLVRVVNDSVETHREMAGRNKIAFELALEPVSLKGNSTLIRNLVDNLVDNAIKYNKDFGSVIIKTKDISSKAQLIVADTGIGMDEKHLTKIFDRFYRIDNSRSRLTGGTGLGLTIVKKVCAVHGATLDVKSTLHEGTEFTITFNK
jgi:two-component system phosphate regulon sensor histidine kinase PhoR